MAVNLGHQVDEIRQQVAIRSVNIDKFKIIRARLGEFCTELAKAYPIATPLVEQFSIKATISAKEDKRSFKILFVIMQVVSDLQLIKDLGQLHSQAIRLKNEAAALKIEVSALSAVMQKVQKNMIAIKAMQKEQALAI